MKSIMEEASTIAKAISKSWERAGKPASFSVKVLEEPQTNFLGMTVKPAKIEPEPNFDPDVFRRMISLFLIVKILSMIFVFRFCH